VTAAAMLGKEREGKLDRMCDVSTADSQSPWKSDVA
jgi:hypothetical protein